ncbi:MAG: hypothetical protein CM15mV139_320 [Caudoviricetes sp.]|nr:MAG: hypothetical protein CM15mV139_320 [Caudoviricetes sp.]
MVVTDGCIFDADIKRNGSQINRSFASHIRCKFNRHWNNRGVDEWRFTSNFSRSGTDDITQTGKELILYLAK